MYYQIDSSVEFKCNKGATTWFTYVRFCPEYLDPKLLMFLLPVHTAFRQRYFYAGGKVDHMEHIESNTRKLSHTLLHFLTAQPQPTLIKILRCENTFIYQTPAVNLTYDLVNGGWSSWGIWRAISPCSGHCGRGFQRMVRNRSCNNPSPRCGGRHCRGSHTEHRWHVCFSHCSRNGKWFSLSLS